MTIIIDSTVQKAYLPGISGCTEQSIELATALREAHSKHRSISVCWLDLANEYGSVHHGLIEFSLQHYGAPSKLLHIVTNMYSNLQSIITCPQWSTKTIPLKIGVYQGDTLLVVIFNIVMCTLADSLANFHHLGYNVSQSQRRIHLLQYADDTCLIGDGPASCQELLRGVDRWLDWSGMKAKIPKCHCLALHASTARSFDPCLTLYGQPIHFIRTKSIKFFVVTIQVPADHHTIRVHLLTKLQSLLAKVDSPSITLHQKLILYRVGVFPRLSWDLMVNDLPLSWIASTLEPMTTYFLKKWVGLARSSEPSRLYFLKEHSGLGLPSISRRS